ncbi:MAG: hypothetical protein Q7J17_10310, partial [Candidatus Deferrimicrobium sp.]
EPATDRRILCWTRDSPKDIFLDVQAKLNDRDILAGLLPRMAPSRVQRFPVNSSDLIGADGIQRDAESKVLLVDTGSEHMPALAKGQRK